MKVKLGTMWNQHSKRKFPVEVDTAQITAVHISGCLHMHSSFNPVAMIMEHRVASTPGLGLHFGQGTTIGIPGHHLPPTLEELALMVAQGEGAERLNEIPVNITHTRGFPQKYLADYLPTADIAK